MGIFRPHKETTKVRMVFLSNLCEKTNQIKFPVSHNNAIWPGPNLNQKITTSLLHLRFDQFLLCFDICKAFNQISLNEVDRSKLCFLWYKNVSRENFEIIGYKNCRLPFGFRCSPTILMLALYKFLF